jgi:hypothetical protein
MSPNFVLSLLLSWFLGFLAVSVFWPRLRRRGSMMVRCCLAFGFGSGISSCAFFCWLCLAGGQTAHFYTYVLLELVLAVSLGLAYWRLAKKTSLAEAEVRSPADDADQKRWSGKLLPLILCAVLLCSVASFILISLRSPHGEFDAVSIWNMRARFLARGGDHWKTAFADSPSLPHADYPLLLSATVAKTWKYVGYEPVYVPAFIAFLFTFSSVGVLWSALALLRNSRIAHLAGIVLLGVNSFVVLGASQYADVVVAFFVVSSLAILALYDAFAEEANVGLLLLASLAAGLCAWTKNEGLLFLSILLAVRFVFSFTRKSWPTCRREMMWMILGVLPVLVVLIYFKAVIAPGNYYLEPGHNDSSGPMRFFLDPEPLSHKLTDGSRYWIIAKAMAGEIMHFGGKILGTTPLLILYFLSVKIKKEAIPSVKAGAAILALMVAGYFAVYLTTPLKLVFHLNTSLSRLFLQLWPGAVFVLFMGTSEPKSEIARER